MANKYLTASGAIATSGTNSKVYRVLGSCTVAPMLVELLTGGSGGSTVWAANINHLYGNQFKVPGIKADYVKLTGGTAQYAVVEFTKGRN